MKKIIISLIFFGIIPTMQAGQTLSQLCYDKKKLHDQLTDAAAQGNLKKVQHILAQGVDVRVRSSYGTTALHGAAFGGNIDIVRLLLAKGADVNDRTHRSAWTPLHCAACHGNTEIVSLLLEHAAQINDDSAHLSNEGRYTPLHLAVKYNHINTVKVLLLNNAQINSKSTNGKTPLHYVSSIAMGELLLKHGANINAIDAIGWMPIHYALVHMMRINAHGNHNAIIEDIIDTLNYAAPLDIKRAKKQITMKLEELGLTILDHNFYEKLYGIPQYMLCQTL